MAIKKKNNFFIRLCYGYVGKHKDTSKMTTKEVIDEFLKSKGVSSPREFFQNKFKTNPPKDVTNNKVAHYEINGKMVELEKSITEICFAGATKKHQVTVFQTADGMKFIWDNEGPEHKQVIGVTQAIKCFYSLPEKLRKLSQKQICFVRFKNPEDTYWSQKYENFTGSLATSGAEITFYENVGVQDENLVETYMHEIAHKIDLDILGGNDRFSESTTYKEIMRKDFEEKGTSSPTLYAKNAPTEDFAESVMMYYTSRDLMEKYFPYRTELIKSLLGE